MLKRWAKRLRCWFKGGHDLVEVKETRYLLVFTDDDGGSRLPIKLTNRYCTRCAPPPVDA
jgi:hypothetical protein